MNNKLERKYGLFTAICMVVGIVIGSGVFFKAQTILQITNGDMPLGVIAWRRRDHARLHPHIRRYVPEI